MTTGCGTGAVRRRSPRGAATDGANMTPTKTRKAPVANTQSLRGPVAIRERSVSGYGVGSGICTATLDSIHMGTVSLAEGMSSRGRSSFGMRLSWARTRRSRRRSSPCSISALNCS